MALAGSSLYENISLSVGEFILLLTLLFSEFLQSAIGIDTKLLVVPSQNEV